MKKVIDLFRRFDAWFTKKFGWFFTNGMKKEQEENKV